MVNVPVERVVTSGAWLWYCVAFRCNECCCANSIGIVWLHAWLPFNRGAAVSLKSSQLL